MRTLFAVETQARLDLFGIPSKEKGSDLSFFCLFFKQEVAVLTLPPKDEIYSRSPGVFGGVRIVFLSLSSV